MTEIKRITSRDNPLIKKIVRLQTSAKSRREEAQFVAEGFRILLDCMENAVGFSVLVISDNFLKNNNDAIEQLLENAQEIICVSDSVFEKISDTKNPQGILAVIDMPKQTVNAINKNGRYIALENIADPSNLGAVSRTAEALGIDGIILSSNGCDPYSPKALRSSMGTLLRMPVIILENFIEQLKQTGMSLYGCVVRDGMPINEVNFSDGSIVIIGNEANGLTADAVNASQKITIPMSGKAESLNAAVAASIAMWELKK